MGAEAAAAIGQSIGPYVLTRQLGEGGMGQVFEGEHKLLLRKVAIKILHPSTSRDDEINRRFLTEARVLAQIRHPGIVEIFDFGIEGDRPFIAMEMLRGRSLRDLLAQHGPLATPLATAIAARVAAVVGVAHDLGIVHRDLKPDNIFIDVDADPPATVKVLDFGIAKVDSRSDTRLTATGALFGTPTYMSPEQVRGSGTVDARSDIYSLGCVLFEMLCGRPPFAADGFGEMLAMHLTAPVPDVRTFVPDASEALDGLVQQLLAKQPAARPSTMADVEYRLAPYAVLLEELGPRLRHGAPRANRATVFWHPTPVSQAPPAPAAAPPRPVAGTVTTFETISLPPAPMPAGGVGPIAVGAGISSDEPGRMLSLKSASAVTAAPTPSSGDVLDDALLAEMKDTDGTIRAFIDTLFAGAPEKFAENTVELLRPRNKELAGYRCFALFIRDTGTLGGAPLGQLETQMFVESARDLERHLEAIEQKDASPRSGARQQKVVFVVATAGALAPGVRELIADFRRKYDAVVIPLYLGELQLAHRRTELPWLFEQRLDALHRAPDPFAIRTNASDPTQLVGFAEEVTTVVGQLAAGGVVISVTGQPGYGKTSLVQMVEYACPRHRFVRVNAGSTESRHPRAFAAEIIQELTNSSGGADRARPTPLSAGTLVATDLVSALRGNLPEEAGPSTGPPPSVRAALKRATVFMRNEKGDRKSPLLVLEDADWLIDLLRGGAGRDALRNEARTLWSALGELARSRALAVIVTSVRGFDLAAPVLEGWDNPVKPFPVALGPFEWRAFERLITGLGSAVNLKFKPGGLDRLFRVSAGNVYVARALCSEILRRRRRGRTYNALFTHEVTAADLRAAERRLVAQKAMGSSFVRWCSEAERQVLQFVATARPKSTRTIRASLSAQFSAETIDDAIETLQAMHLIEFGPNDSAGHRVAVPTLEAWLREHLDIPLHRVLSLRNLRMKRIAFGASTTVLLLALYYTWLHTPRQKSPHFTEAPCIHSVDYPAAGSPNEEITIYVFRQCDSGLKSNLRLEPIETAAKVGTFTCDPADLTCAAPVTVALADNAGAQYTFGLFDKERLLGRFSLKKDALATFRRTFSRVFELASLFPALLGIFLAFRRDMFTGIRQLFVSEGENPVPELMPAAPGRQPAPREPSGQADR